MADTTQDIRALVAWASKYEIPLHSQVEVYQDPLTGLSFRARADLPPFTKVVDCSYQISISYLNAISASSFFPRHNSELFPREFIDRFEQEKPHIIGHFFLIQQYLMGEKSFWSPYIKLLPQPAEPERLGIPNWWPAADQKFLEGTNAYPPITVRERQWRSDFAKGYALLHGRLDNSAAYTYTLYKWAATIFGSRSFRASLTIPPILIASTLVKEHVEKDSFAVLFPLMDIGNHNGVGRADWLKDATAGHLSLLIRSAVVKGTQIFNYYGDKHNSELLTAYGFILPNPDHDKFNLKLQPSPVAKLLRRSQSCHPRASHAQPEIEFMFGVGMSYGNTGVQTVLKSFSHGLVESVICMVANSREQVFIQENPDYCIEKAPCPYGSPLSRAFIIALSTICEVLMQDIKMIEDTGANLGEPQNKNQEIALKYRQGQIHTLKGTSDLITELLRQTVAFNFLCPHSPSGLGKHEEPNFLSLECAYGWLEQYYPVEFGHVTDWISENQDEPVPLDWAAIVGDWDRTYWIAWIMTLWMCRRRDANTFSTEHGTLDQWLSPWSDQFDSVADYLASDMTDTLRADSSEKDEIDGTIRAILLIPSFADVAKTARNSDRYQMKLRNYISYIVQEETVSLSYTMQHQPQAGKTVSQKMLYIEKSRPYHKPNEPPTTAI